MSSRIIFLNLEKSIAKNVKKCYINNRFKKNPKKRVHFLNLFYCIGKIARFFRIQQG